MEMSFKVVFSLILVSLSSVACVDTSLGENIEIPGGTIAAELVNADNSNEDNFPTSETDDAYQRKVFVDSIGRGLKEHPQHLTVPDESLAVDGDVVRKVYSQPDLDLPPLGMTSSNVTINVNSSQEASPNATFRCTCITGKENGGQPVEMVNSTRLLNILITEPNVTNRKSPADCVALLFYAQYCSFSALAAPHFNALPRAFPDIKMAAVDAMKFHSFNTQYGIVGVPTVVLFHNGRPVAKFNDSEYTLELFAKFITKNTGIEPDNKLLYVMSADFGGPISSVPIKETDYCLAISWMFIILCGFYFFSKSAWWKWIVEMVQNTWRESREHEHAE